MSQALADLSASINLMPYSLYEKLELGELTPTCMSLSLADRSVKYLRGIIENLLVKVDKFVFFVDFVVLDMEADEKVPIILGCMDKCFDYICGTDLVGSNGLVDCDDLGEDESCEDDSVCDELDEISGLPEMIEVNEISCENEAVSEEKPAPLELKVLPSHLEYAYLDEGSNLPVIVSSKLTEEQKSKLIDVLKLHKGAIAWRLFDIQGISTAYYMHRILMEDEYKPVVQLQRRLNQNMQEVVKKEVLKLMDARMIYPISDSPWVSLTQVVPKKGGMTIVMNEKNELIPSRTVTGWRIKDKKGAENVAADHLSCLEDPRREELHEEEIGYDYATKEEVFRDVNRYVWDDPFLLKIGGDRILRRCVTKEKGWDILKHVHEGLTGGHHVVKDAEEFVKLCDACQRTAYKTALGTTLFMLFYGKSCHLPVELEHRAYWALKTVNVDLTEAARERYFQIHELEELRDATYSRSLNIKEKTKALHDRRLKGSKEFKKGDKVLLFNSRLKLFAGKLRSKWTGPYLVKEVFPYGMVELENPDNGMSWKVNGHRLKHYLGGPDESIDVEETPLDPSH
ncbi:uncharacterized protein LOC143622003 [Bidens hawaiensis]|uniref:uncharacterized protein LOC143622003 n=1 Tax=Bidens hawaiensis TaxID=980011 RepID=UPI00404B4D11